jgi:hypothetical protein
LGASPSRIGLRSRVIAAKHAKREKKKEEDARETREKTRKGNLSNFSLSFFGVLSRVSGDLPCRDVK